MTTWTVVTRKSGRGQFHKTGFEGTWQEAREEGVKYADQGLDAWVVCTGDTKVMVDSGRWVGIARTRAERAAAKAEAARVDAVVYDLMNSWVTEHLQGQARALLHGAYATPLAAAIALAEAGWTRQALGRRMS